MKIHVNKSETIKGYEALLETKLDASTRGGVFCPLLGESFFLTVNRS